MEAIKIIFSLLTKTQKFDFIKIFILILLMTLLETFGIALVIPAVKVLISNDFYLVINRYVQPILNTDFEKIDIIIFGLVFILSFFILKFLFSIFTIYKQLNFNYGVQVNSSKKLYDGYLNQEYERYTHRNSSLLVRNVTNLIDKFCALLENCFTILTDLTLFVGITCFLLYLDFLGTTVIFGLFIAIAALYYLGTKNKFNIWGKLAVNYEFFKFKFLYEGLTSLKDIRISENENYFSKNYSDYVSKHGKITLIRNFIKILPKQTYEIVAVFSLVILSLSLIYQGKTLENFLPTAGVFAVAAFKILPSGNRLLLAFQNMRFHYQGLKILKDELVEIENYQKETKNLNNLENFELNNKIQVKNLKFKYKLRDQIVLKNINFEITKNHSVGIIGESGSGKSTLMDLIIGLYKPTEGEILCDKKNITLNRKSWYKNIGYVPQSIQLFDNSIKMNIAFGIDEKLIDIDRVKECLRMTKLDEWVNSLSEGEETLVGDKGIRISGGQRQRIGIARALYNKPKILFFDESTSSLDLKTEDELMNEVNTLLKDITKVIISHRLATLKNCDKIYLIKNGEINESGNFEKMSNIKLNDS